MKVRTEENGD